MLNRHPRSRAGVAGFTLIEVLVALIVLSIGLLGLAALQIQSIKHNTDAYFRTQATLLAYDIIDRMRANSAAVSAGIYEVSAPPATEVTCGEDAAGCGSAAELAAYDLTRWYQALDAALPPVPGSPSSIDINGHQVTVTIRWSERGVAKSRQWIVQL
jgi:type IV pilus assembly protein PilV